MAAINPPPTDVNGALLKDALPVDEACVAVAPVESLVLVTVVVPEWVPVPVPVPVLVLEVTDAVVVVVVESLPSPPYSLA